jgi:Myb/SANT-like DNA-binding domain
MPSKRVRKAPPTALIDPTALIGSIEAIPTPQITLGEQAPNELAPSQPCINEYPELLPLPTNDLPTTLTEEESETEDDKENKLAWSEEMLEQLVEVLYSVFMKGGAADNSFKKSTFESAAKEVRKVYKGKLEVTYAKCKNKWADLKRKWQHWVVLSNQSGIGWNEETELYDFYDYVWEGLNKAYPKIIWHKTHVMPLRDLIGAILHDVQANGSESFSLNILTPIDPRLLALDTTRVSSIVSPASSSASKAPKTIYNKSKKRAWFDTSDDLEDDTLAPVALPVGKKIIVNDNNKVDIGAALSELSKELGRARKAKELYQTTQQKAIILLEQEYKERLDMLAFIQACEFLGEDKHATTFITLLDHTVRDRWLEIQLTVELLPVD